jgi:hypothetical protein
MSFCLLRNSCQESIIQQPFSPTFFGKRKVGKESLTARTRSASYLGFTWTARRQQGIKVQGFAGSVSDDYEVHDLCFLILLQINLWVLETKGPSFDKLRIQAHYSTSSGAGLLRG